MRGLVCGAAQRMGGWFTHEFPSWDSSTTCVGYTRLPVVGLSSRLHRMPAILEGIEESHRGCAPTLWVV